MVSDALGDIMFLWFYARLSWDLSCVMGLLDPHSAANTQML